MINLQSDENQSEGSEEVG